MAWQDIVNGLFECFGGIMNWLNVYAIYKDKAVKGVNIWASVVFTLWGGWNLYYYPHLDQWASFVGGCVIVSANFTWIYLAFKYRNNL